MSISFDYYKTFYYVAKYKKISYAAEKLFVSQPAVTQTIQNLEKQLNSTLLIRNNSGIKLSYTGQLLYNFIKPCIETLENMPQKISNYENFENSTLKIIAGNNLANLMIYDAIEKFGKDYPTVKIDLLSNIPEKSIQALDSGLVDIILSYLPFDLTNPKMQIIECSKKEYVFAMSKNYFNKNNVKIDKLEDFNNYSLILPQKNTATRLIFDNNFKDIITNYHYEVGQEKMKKDFIQKDMGISFIIKDTIIDEINSGEIIEVNLESARCSGGIGLITLKDTLCNPVTLKFIEYILKYTK